MAKLPNIDKMKGEDVANLFFGDPVVRKIGSTKRKEPKDSTKNLKRIGSKKTTNKKKKIGFADILKKKRKKVRGPSTKLRRTLNFGDLARMSGV